MEVPNLEQSEETTDNRYIQQHLANERTYLAWLRTAITVSGLGFLVANLHFAVRKELTVTGNYVASAIGLISVCTGVSIIGLATWSYLMKRKDINTKRFRAISTLTIGISVMVAILILAIASYFLLYI